MRRQHMSPRTVTRKSRPSPDTREKILQVSARLFLKNGYDATTMQDIVAAARTSIGNVYFYFESKEALVWTLLKNATTAAWASTDEAIAAVPRGPARLVVMVLSNALNLLGPTTGLARILLLDSATATLRERVASRFASRIRSYILENVPDYPRERIDLAVAAWIGAGRNVIQQRLLGALEAEPRDLGLFLVRWNLRSLGVPEAEIDDAIALALPVVEELEKERAR